VKPQISFNSDVNIGGFSSFLHSTVTRLRKNPDVIGENWLPIFGNVAAYHIMRKKG
jgi:hypothetical protein